MTIVNVDRKPILGSTVRAGTRQASIAIDATLISTHQEPDSTAVVGTIIAPQEPEGIALESAEFYYQWLFLRENFPTFVHQKID